MGPTCRCRQDKLKGRVSLKKVVDDRTLLLYGPRGVGKTTVVQMALLGRRPVVEVTVNSETEDFFSALLQKIPNVEVCGRSTPPGYP